MLYKKVIYINLIIVAALFIANLVNTRHEQGEVFGRFAFTGIMTLLMAMINLIIGAIKAVAGKPDGKTYLLIAGVLLLIGFSVCTGVVG